MPWDGDFLEMEGNGLGCLGVRRGGWCPLVVWHIRVGRGLSLVLDWGWLWGQSSKGSLGGCLVFVLVGFTWQCGALGGSPPKWACLGLQFIGVGFNGKYEVVTCSSDFHLQGRLRRLTLDVDGNLRNV